MRPQRGREARVAALCGQRQRLQRALSRLSAAGGVCSVSTHLAGKSALEEAVVRVIYVPSDVRVSGRSVHCQCVSDAIRSAAYSPPIGRFCFR